MKVLRILSLICIVLCFIFLICGENYLSYGKGYKSNPNYKSRIVGGGGGMSYFIPVESNNERYLRYEGDNINYSDVRSFLQMHRANFFENRYHKDDFYPKIDFYGENEADDMLNIIDPSELLNKISSNTKNTFTIKATGYNNIGEIEKITIVEHKYNVPNIRNINLDVIHASETPYIVINHSALIIGISMIIMAPITLILGIILYIAFLKRKLRLA